MRHEGPRRTLVLGAGNPSMGDDGFGAAVLDVLRTEGAPPGVELADAGTDLLAHLDDLARHDHVILVDAVLSEGARGDVACHTEEELAGWPHDAPTGHQISPVLAIALFRRLWPAATTRISLVALHADRIGLGAGLSRPGAAREGAAAVRSLCESHEPP